MLDLVFQNHVKDKSFRKDFFERILGVCSGSFKMKDMGISVNLVGESKIRELNKKYRKKDKVTDVLSFPMSEKLEIGNPPGRMSVRTGWKLEIPKSNASTLDLGDIFICLSFAKKEAKSENISIDRKLAQLTVHGFLHLMGYDHEKSERDEKEMFNLENSILKKL